MNVFISHSAADKNFALKLATELRSHGHTVSHPVDEMNLGENLALRVGKALESADAMVALLSPDSAHSEWFENEIGYALTSPKFQERLIPVMVRKTENIPWILNNLDVLGDAAKPASVGRIVSERLRRQTLRASRGHGIHHARRVRVPNAVLARA
jgi:TIR domain